MPVAIANNTKVYVMCPPQTFTGGPELLHQLVYTLRDQGINAFMFYYPEAKDPVHENFVKYGNPFVTEIEDATVNLLIVPEIHIDVASAFKQIRKCVWWLSIDNLFKPYLAKGLRKVVKKLGMESLYRYLTIQWAVKGKFDHHLVQSYYASTFLKRFNIDNEYLSDYLTDQILEASSGIQHTPRKKQVLYNPKKGFAFTQQIMEAGKNIQWVPLVGLNPSEVMELLATSMVYIDFGEHPGKDRFPREAAVFRCCIITGLKGSAAFAEDLCIPASYKFEDSVSNIPHVLSKIHNCMDNYDALQQDFEPYRNRIYGEKEKFKIDVERIFIQEMP